MELDVRTCAGGNVVVFHDTRLPSEGAAPDAPPEGGRRVRDVDLRELRALGVPTLEESLAWATAHGIAVNVELKHDVPDRAALARRVVRAVRSTRADVLLSSFDPLLLGIAGALSPNLPRALLVHSGQPLWADLLQRGAAPPWVGFVHLDRTQAHADVIARHLGKGLRVGVWTVNDAEEAAHLVRLGVSSIITDCPGAIRAALTRS